MAAIRENVASALFTLLDSMRAPSPTVVKTVERDRSEPMTPDLCPALVLHTASPATVAEETDDHVRYTVRMAVEGYARGATDAASVTALNALYAETRKAIYANRTLSGAAFDITEQETDQSIDREQGHAPMAHFAMTLKVEYQTQPGDPFTAP